MRNHRIYLALALVGLLPALACNLPSRARMLANETPASLAIVTQAPAALGFDVASFVASAGGYLSAYTETVDDETLSGAQIVQRIAAETSTNPRLLLGLLEFRSGWVFGQPRANSEPEYPLGFENPAIRGLDPELRLALRYLSQGYYGERAVHATAVQQQGFAAAARVDADLKAVDAQPERFK